MRHSYIFTTCLLFMLLLACCPTGAWSQEAQTAKDDMVGSVRTVVGQPEIVRGQDCFSASTGDHLYMDDILTTTREDAVGIILRDDTMVSLGPSSEFKIDSFVFEPAQDKLSFISDLTRGTALFVTGQMAKIAPESLKVHTPNSIIGIRGTRFVVKVD